MVAKQSAGTKPKPAAAVDAAGTAKAPLKPKESIKVFARFRPLEPGAELARDLLAYEPDGSLLVPAVDVPLRFRRVDEGG